MRWASTTLAVLCVLTASAPAQWINYPTPGIPRTPDGQPNLSAPAPRTAQGKPDFSGMWREADPLPCDGINRVCGDLAISVQFGNLGVGLKDGVPYQPWASEKIKHKGLADDPYTNCLARGGPRMHLLPTMKKLVQTPSLIVILDEYNASFRQIFTDGRPLPVDPQPTWNGYSTGHWDGDTLVVDSIGYRDDQWLDARGSPLTEAGKVTERFRRPNFGNLEIEVTINDPKAYTRPWTATIHQTVVVDTELIDLICMENEKDVQHLTVK
ncbi:MAG TPA: hypothetical protein VLM42_16890 [Bryobacteraceae bacterium]|nr:hypothetical protein [Bryobacteraceae bacterium]